MMRFLIILFLIIPVFLFSQTNQTDANGLRQGFWQKQQPNGRLLYQGNFSNGKPVGEWKRFHEGGQLKAKIQYRPDSDSAFTELFDELGKKVAEGMYLNEKKTGLWNYFSENRKVADEYFENGLKNGPAHKYYETGEIWEKSNWKMGQQEGNYEVFFKSGEPFFQCKMAQNKRNGLCLTYFLNGKVELEALYKNGLRHGEWKYFNENGEYLYSLFYSEGEILNPEVRDSVNNLQLQNIEKNKDKLIDPAKYTDNPAEYMRKMNVYK